MDSVKDRLKRFDEKIEQIEKVISELKDENELIRLRIKKKELVLMKLELEEIK